jgi:hypothetical protein
MIRKVKSGWRVYSHKTHRVMGTYKNRSDARKRLKQIARFSNHDKTK